MNTDCAIEELFRKYYKVLCAYAYRLTGDKYMAEDIVQDIYYGLWRRKDSLVIDDAIKFYLFRAVYTQALNHQRIKSYAFTSIDHITDTQIQLVYLQHHASDQESDLIRKELQEHIDRIIDGMPEQCRKVFLLSRKHDLKNREIAEKMNISVKTVEKHIAHAMSILRKALQHVIGMLLWMALLS